MMGPSHKPTASYAHLLESQDLQEKLVAQHYRWSSAILPFLFPAFGGLLFGYDTGATSSAAVCIESPELSGVSWYSLTPMEMGFLESGSLYGAVLGCVLAFTIADYLGRRRELIAASVFYFLGSLLMALAPSLSVLLVGRVVYGLGIGMAMHGGPLYIAETCPTSIRGTLVSMKEGAIVVGMLIGYLIGYLAMGLVGGWRIMYAAAAPLALIMSVGMWWLPRSPRWILLCAYKGGANMGLSRKDAVAAIQRLLGQDASHDDVECQLNEIQHSLRFVTDQTSIRELFQGTCRRALMVGIGLVLFQQFTGQPSVLYYASKIFQKAGFSSASDAAKCSLLLGAFKIVMTLLAVWRVDRVGRRPLLIGGIGVLTISLFLLAAYYAFIPGSVVFALIALLLYVGAYQVSFGPMGWLLLSEIFPLRMRAWASSFTLVVNFSANAIVTFIFAPLQEAIGTAGTFACFGVIGLAALVFIILYVPETKGLSLEEIEARLSE